MRVQRGQPRRVRLVTGGERAQRGVDRAAGAADVGEPGGAAEPDVVEPDGDVGIGAQIVAARDLVVQRVDEVNGQVAADETRSCFHRKLV